MASASTPTYFRPYVNEARKAAARAGLGAPYFRSQERPDPDLVRTTTWRSRDLTIPLVDVAGRWTAYMSYEFQLLRGEKERRLVRTSIGLNVVGVPFASGQPRTLIRYDFDALLDADLEANGEEHGSVAAHINVLQPDPLADHVHLPGFRRDRWAADEVLAWITSRRLLVDLKKRLPG